VVTISKALAAIELVGKGLVRQKVLRLYLKTVGEGIS